jgi:hypothetical protein
VQKWAKKIEQRYKYNRLNISNISYLIYLIMKRFVFTVMLLITLHFSLFSQEDVTGCLKIQDIQRMLLGTPAVPEAVREQVVKRIVTWHFKATKNPKTIYFAAENIKKEWLPAINNIEFVVLEQQPPDGYKRKVFFFREVERAGKGFTIGFGYGDPNCDAEGKTWTFRIKNSRVKLWQGLGIWLTGCDSASGNRGS